MKENFSSYIARDFDHYLFPSQKGIDKPLSRQQIWCLLKSAGESVGLTNIGSHSMRKTFGYFLYKNNTDLVIIQELLNHSSQKTTLRYIGIRQEERDTAVQRLDL